MASNYMHFPCNIQLAFKCIFAYCYSSTPASSYWSTTASPISSTTASPISSTTASLGLYLHPVTFSSATVSPGLSSYSATISSTTTISGLSSSPTTISPTTARPGLSSPTATFSSTTASLGLSSSHATFLSTTASPEWSIWSECSTTCGNGYRTRRSFGVMNYGTETKSCKIIYCPVDGMWGDWSKSECSTSCGGWGKIYFNRSCNYPSPMYYGRVCMGLNNYTDDCLDDRTCPVNGIWSEWSVWSLCNKPCERGVMSRFRTCSNPKYGGQYCNGSSIQTTYCPLQLCNKMSLIVNIYLPEDPYQPYYSTLDHPGSVVLKNNIETAIANLYKKLKTNATFNIELNTITDGDP
ncbi:coadhesin [Hydra vulgaris]|uniref:coadhesin n=1 Tax=Hydra vulgaris TaxID=6087 RepID=UPI0032EA13E2